MATNFSCGISAGNPIPCKTFMPGIRRMAIAQFFSGTTNIQENLTYTLDSTGTATGATLTTGKAYIFDLTKEAGDIQDAIHSSAPNGTTSFESTITVYLANYSTTLKNQVAILTKLKCLVWMEDRNGQWLLFGTDGTGTIPSTSNGVDLMDSTATPGKAYGSDPNGYTLVFNCVEKVQFVEFSSTVMAGLLSN